VEGKYTNERRSVQGVEKNTMSINIGGENAGDAFYRYKMPKLVARVSCCNTR
jgi:hypothetical protein